MPIAPELHRLLLGAFEDADSGQDRVIAKGRINVKNVSRDFTVLCRRANVVRYAKPLHTLRKSCLTDWAARFQTHVVKEWAGHTSIQTTDEFYLKVSDADYATAASQDFTDVTQLVTQPANFVPPREKPESEDSGEKALMKKRASGFEPPTSSLGSGTQGDLSLVLANGYNGCVLLVPDSGPAFKRVSVSLVKIHKSLQDKQGGVFGSHNELKQT